MFITADQLLVHAIGDYLLQSDWMAVEKTKKNTAALAHAICYTLCFLFLTRSIPALAFIAVTHFIIDRWRLARYICWAKNWLAPKWIERLGTDPIGLFGRSKLRNYPWSECTMTGYSHDRPPFLAVWLLIIADNVLHVICNGIALKYLS